MSESNNDKLRRVVQMATGSPTWDLSDNDIAALQYVLNSRTEAFEALNDILKTPDHPMRKKCKDIARTAIERVTNGETT